MSGWTWLVLDAYVYPWLFMYGPCMLASAGQWLAMAGPGLDGLAFHGQFGWMDMTGLLCLCLSMAVHVWPMYDGLGWTMGGHGGICLDLSGQ